MSRVYRTLRHILEKEPSAMKTIGRNRENTLLLIKAGGSGGEVIPGGEVIKWEGTSLNSTLVIRGGKILWVISWNIHWRSEAKG